MSCTVQLVVRFTNGNSEVDAPKVIPVVSPLIRATSLTLATVQLIHFGWPGTGGSIVKTFAPVAVVPPVTRDTPPAGRSAVVVPAATGPNLMVPVLSSVPSSVIVPEDLTTRESPP